MNRDRTFTVMASALLLLAALATGVPAWADVKAGVAAYKRGDYARAYEEFAELAQRGDQRAQYNLGVLYLTGRGVSKDASKATDWHRKAARQGLAVAQHGLGVLYYRGTGVTQDYLEAAAWFRKAADQGLPNAQFNLGVMYFNGEGVRENLSEVVKWVSLAAGQGFADAQFRLGIMYEEGTGLSKDSREAVKWFRMAANKGHDQAGTRAAALAAKIEDKALAAAEPPGPAPGNMPAADGELRPPEVEPAAGPGASPEPPLPPAPPPIRSTPIRSAPIQSAMAALKPPPRSAMAAAGGAPAGTGPKTWRVQLAALRSLDDARKSWNALKRAHKDLLTRVEPVIKRVDLGPGKGVYHRLQAGPLKGRADAVALCAAPSSGGVPARAASWSRRTGEISCRSAASKPAAPLAAPLRDSSPCAVRNLPAPCAPVSR